MPKLLAAAALGEAVVGLLLLLLPRIIVHLLFGAPVVDAGIVITRVAGIALLALGVGCFQGRDNWSKNSPALWAMLTYSSIVTFYLIYLGIGREWAGPLLWPAVLVHAIVTVVLARQWFKERMKTPERLS